jgi:hypothetical protein
MEPIELRASMLWAALVRGMASLEKTVTPASASLSTSSGSPGTVQEADEDLSLSHLAHLVLCGPGDLDDDVGLAVDLPGVRGDPRPDLLVILIEVVVSARPGLDEYLEAPLDELLDGLGDQPDPPFSFGYLPRNPYLHAEDYSRVSESALPWHTTQ